MKEFKTILDGCNEENAGVKAWRKFVLKTHPDKDPAHLGDPQFFVTGLAKYDEFIRRVEACQLQKEEQTRRKWKKQDETQARERERELARNKAPHHRGPASCQYPDWQKEHLFNCFAEATASDNTENYFREMEIQELCKRKKQEKKWAEVKDSLHRDKAEIKVLT